MISGRVELLGEIAPGHQILEPRVSSRIAASGSGIFRSIDFAIDTGFTAWLTLPPDIIREFGLVYQGTRTVTLANGEQDPREIYLAFIEWHGRILPRLVHESASNPLLGMGLLTGSRLTVESVAGGSVTIEEMTTT